MTQEHTPGVDYRATSARRRFEELPAEVRATAEALLGSAVVEADPPVGSGFTRAYAGRVRLRDGRQVFLKATGPELPVPVRALRREAQVLATVGHLLPSVPLVAAGSSPDGGSVLALAWVDGHLPGFPWTEAEIDLVQAACEQLATIPAGALAALEPGRLHTDLLDEQLRSSLSGGLRLPASLSGLPRWLPDRVEEVVRVALDADTLVGDRVNHFDLRPDNLVVGRLDGAGPVRAFVLDWNWLTLGPAWCDWAGLVPTMHDQGHDLPGLLARTALSRDAEPAQLAAWFAIIAVYMLQNLDADPPMGTTVALRQHARYYARIFLAALAVQRRWEQ
ncbi:MAG TPA: hypothetical protein VFJ97_15350 [Dermatophilaceae bacterium]|nr:hypothetical protein [Dermatophilaceae bacterium]